MYTSVPEPGMKKTSSFRKGRRRFEKDVVPFSTSTKTKQKQKQKHFLIDHAQTSNLRSRDSKSHADEFFNLLDQLRDLGDSIVYSIFQHDNQQHRSEVKHVGWMDRC